LGHVSGEFIEFVVHMLPFWLSTDEPDGAAWIFQKSEIISTAQFPFTGAKIFERSAPVGPVLQ
jgi:hypothetical protein